MPVNSDRFSAAEPKRPNFLFVLVDDQSPFDLKIYNPRSSLDSPVIDRLASEGMVLDGAYHMGSGGGSLHPIAAHDHVRANCMAFATSPARETESWETECRGNWFLGASRSGRQHNGRSFQSCWI